MIANFFRPEMDISLAEYINQPQWSSKPTELIHLVKLKLISFPESWKIGRLEFVSAIEDLSVYIYCRIDVVCCCSRSMASFKDRIGISPVEFTVEKWRYRHINIAIEQRRKHGANIMRIPFTISQNF